MTDLRSVEELEEGLLVSVLATVEEVEKRLTDSNVHVYDGNNDDVYAEGHIPGAIHLLSKDIKEGVLPADKATMLIFYCHSER